jgi:hypothetical protein
MRVRAKLRGLVKASSKSDPGQLLGSRPEEVSSLQLNGCNERGGEQMTSQSHRPLLLLRPSEEVGGETLATRQCGYWLGVLPETISSPPCTS